MILKVADFYFEILNLYRYISNQSNEYAVENHIADHSFKITAEDIEAERKISEGDFSLGYIESIAAYRKIAEWLPLNEAFVLHSAVFEVGGEGVALAAQSGTGKTTHMRLWKKLLGENMTVVNGDKPIIRFFADNPNTPYAYGTPWNGKEGMGRNTRTPLKHICFIERGKTNSVLRLTASDVIKPIFSQVYMPKNPAAAAATLSLISRLISGCSLWKISCNMELDAAQVAYNALFNKEKLK